MKRNILVLLMIAMVVLLNSTDMIIHKNSGEQMVVAIDEVDQITFEQYEEVIAEGITLQWRTDENYLHIILSAPTTGWVAVGFDPQVQMQGADILIGYYNGEAIMSDEYGNSTTGHTADTNLGGTNDIMNISGMEEDGNTQLKFMIPLDSGDDYDNPLVPGNQHTVILAYGPSDNFTSYHTVRTIIQLTL